MRVIIQRVLSGTVTVEGAVVGSIGPGLMILLGISREDTLEKVSQTVNKVLSIRLWESNDGKKWDRSVVDKEFEVLVVSQFTLYSVLKGNKPDFHNAMNPDQAHEIYQAFLTDMRNKYPGKVQNGAFGQYMNVSIVGDGPVTIELNY